MKRWIAGVTLASVLATFGPASAADGSGDSYWGPVPIPADSVTASFEDPPRQMWEYPVDAVWWTAKLPFTVAGAGLKAGTSWVEESGTFARIARLLRPLDLPYGFTFGGSTGRLSGFTGTFGVYHDELLGEDNRFRARAALSTRNNRRVTGGWIVNFDEMTSMELGAGYRVRRRARYFGVGLDTADSDRSFFTQESGWAGLTVKRELGWESLALEGTALWSSMASRGPGETDDVALTERFAGDLPAGYAVVSTGVDLELTLRRDTTGMDGRPRGGGTQRLVASLFLPENEDENGIVTYRAEAQHFIDLWWDRQLALRGFFGFASADDGEAIHFQRLQTNDDPDLLRGFEDFRFRDRGLTAFTAEYRWPVWDYRDPGVVTIDAYGFYDAGQVFGNRREIALRELEHSYGGGFRFSVGGGFVGRLEVGFSDEDTVFRIRGDQTFQFDRRGLYHGREPIPVR